MKILILKPSSLGDIVQALPVLRLLKLHLPQSEIYWWLVRDWVPLLEGDPDLKGIFPFERKRWSAPWHWDELLSSIRQMRAHRFDWVIDLQGLARSGTFAWLVNGGFTVGVDDPREGASGFYDAVVPRASFHTHAVDWYLETLTVLDVPARRSFTWLPERPEAAADVERKWQPGSARWLILHPGARWANKLWPVDYFAALVLLLAHGDAELRFAILGGAEESATGERIARACPDRCLNLTGQTSLPEMVEWIRLSELMVTNDSGPMHVAAALGKPVVALFGPTEPRRTGPYQQIDQVVRMSLPCAPCMKATCAYEKPIECLRAITPLAVCREVQRRLAVWPKRKL